MKHYDYEISRFVEDELPETEKIELRAHLSVCEKCRQTLSDYEELRDNIKRFYDDIPKVTEAAPHLTGKDKIYAIKPIKNKNRIKGNDSKPKWIRRLLIPAAIAASIIAALMIFQLKTEERHVMISHEIKPKVPGIMKNNPSQVMNNNIVKRNHGIDRYPVKHIKRFMENIPTSYPGYSIAIFNDVINKSIVAMDDSLKNIQCLLSLGRDSRQTDYNSSNDSTLMKLGIETYN